MNTILNKAELPNLNKLSKKTHNITTINLSLLVNKFNNILKSQNLDLSLQDIFKFKSDFNKNTSSQILDNIFESINYKNLAGIRLEAKGRLTKRFTASRSLFKVK
jgi:hypothetical protein